MFENQLTIAISFMFYVLLMFAIAWFAWKDTQNLSDYILGGRRIGPWVAALSAGASDMSGWLLLGVPGYAYAAGFEAFWLASGLLLGAYCNWKFIALRLRIYSQQANDSLTLPAFFAARFKQHEHLLQVISALFILVFFMFYTSSGLVAGGKLFQTVFDFPYHWAVTLGMLIIVGYTFMGGFLAVAWTDLLQGLLMLAALLIVPVVSLQAAGGWDNSLATIQQHNPHLLELFTDSQGQALTSIAILSLLGWGFGYFGQPHILARFQAIKSPRLVARSRQIAVTWSLLTMLGAVLAGIVGIAYIQPGLSNADSEQVFMLLISALFHPLIAGILLAAILAAIMSTADSQLLVSSSALAEDFYKALLKPQAADKELIWVGRAAVIIVAVIAYIIALTPNSKVLDLVSYAWAGFGAAFGPCLIFALYWRRMNSYGALAGIISGGITVVVWKQLSGGWFDLYEIVPGVIIASSGIVLVSLVTTAPQANIIHRHNEIEQQLKHY